MKELYRIAVMDRTMGESNCLMVLTRLVEWKGRKEVAGARGSFEAFVVKGGAYFVEFCLPESRILAGLDQPRQVPELGRLLRASCVREPRRFKRVKTGYVPTMRTDEQDRSQYCEFHTWQGFLWTTKRQVPL